jgi:hypothetical protein
MAAPSGGGGRYLIPGDAATLFGHNFAKGSDVFGIFEGFHQLGIAIRGHEHCSGLYITDGQIRKDAGRGETSTINPSLVCQVRAGGLGASGRGEVLPTL